MSVPAVLDYHQQDLRRHLWQAAVHYAAQSRAASLGHLAPVINEVTQVPHAALPLLVDTVADALTRWADDLAVNPACLASKLVEHADEHLPAEGVFLLVAAYNTLLLQDPLQQAAHPHASCVGWPDDYRVAPLSQVAGGQLLLEVAVMAEQLDLQPPKAAQLAVHGPQVLAHLLTSRYPSDQAAAAVQWQAFAQAG